MSDMKNNSTVNYDTYPLDVGSLLKLFIVGVAAGALGWLLYLGISHYFIEPVFCRSAETYGFCRNGGTIAWIVGHIIVLAAAVAILARFAVYRPLLIVLAVLVSLWSSHSWLGGMEWYLGLAWQAVLFGIAVAVYGWIARTTNFILALVATILVIVMARVVLMLS